ncbi:unnamed protein product, partial [Ectocarpus sp. 8 AP-2014]
MDTAVTCLVREKEQPEECRRTDRPLLHVRWTLRLARQEGTEGGTPSSGGNYGSGDDDPAVFRTIVEV